MDFFIEKCSKKLKFFLDFFDYLLKASKTTDNQDKSNIFDLFCFLKKNSNDHVFIWGQLQNNCSPFVAWDNIPYYSTFVKKCIISRKCQHGMLSRVHRINHSMLCECRWESFLSLPHAPKLYYVSKVITNMSSNDTKEASSIDRAEPERRGSVIRLHK